MRRPVRTPIEAPFAALLQATMLAAALALAAAPVQARDEPAVALTPQARPADLATQVFTTSDPAAIKGMKRVAMPSFQVEFVTRSSAQASTSGFASAGRTSVSAYYTLVGVGEADFQALTNQLHADFVRDLQQMGVEVVPFAQVQASPAYRKLAAGAQPAPYSKSGGGTSSVALAPAGQLIYGSALIAAKSDSMFGAFSTLANTGAMMGAAFDTIDLAKELDARIVDVRLVVDFAQIASSDKGFLSRLSSTASVDGKVQPALLAGASMMSVQSATMRTTVMLRNPLLLPPAAISGLREATSTATQAGNVAAALINLAAGGKNSSSAADFEAVADPAVYRASIGASLGQVREMLVSRLKAEQ
jgi:hypothetical protein